MRRHVLHRVGRTTSAWRCNALLPIGSAAVTSLQNATIQEQPSAQSGAWQYFALTAGLVAAAGYVGAPYHIEQAHCAAEIPMPSANPKGDQFLEEFKRWLERNGCATAAIDIRPCRETPAAGLGVYASEEGLAEKFRRTWWQWASSRLSGQQDVVLASFPLGSIVTARSITADQELGHVYKQLLDQGRLDERQLTMLFLLVERIRGPDSAWKPWISMLPQSFNTPLFFGKADLEELRGTTLHTATQVLKNSLKEEWKGLGPAVEQVLQAAGTAAQGTSATFEDFLWAYAIFWSRSITFPEPNNCPVESSTAAQPREGIVPGLDFCNHAPGANSRWSVWNPASTKGRTPESVALLTRRSAKLTPNQEVTICYGDKSNEELLLQYGFTLDRNPDDALMVVCPLPPAKQWDAGMAAKMQLLHARGLSPQLFLTAAELEKEDKGKDAVSALGLSDATWEVLEVLTMEPQQAINAAADLPHAASDPAHDIHVTFTGLNPVEASGLRLAKMTSLRRLLELKLAELEGSEGTGSLERDIRILEAADSAMPPVLRSCLVYRASQKRLTRGFLSKVERAQAKEMLHMQSLRTDKQ